VFESYRLFNCNRCHVQVRICQRCDHGNIYCRPCAPEARSESVLRSGAKYQRKERGRENHAARQQRYLDNQERDHAVRQQRCLENKEMTHHGSPVVDEASQLPAPQPEVPATSVLRRENANVQYQLQPSSESDSDETTEEDTESPGAALCDFCGQPCGPYARLDFLRTPRRRTRRHSSPAATVFT
jgi:hypothetical protein